MKKFVSIALAAAIALAPSAAVAQTTVQLRFFWYADEFSSTVVGEYIHYCNGASYQWGQATAYPGEMEQYDC
jgi:hypothetical protein